MEASEATHERIDVVEYGSRRAIVTLAVIVAAMMEIIDTTIVTVALPTIQGNLGADIDEGTWIVTGYIIANVIVIPLTPWLQMRFGRRLYFTASIVVFTLASFLCGLANSIETLVLFRLIQGLAGGGLISTAQTILNDTYPRSQQNAATGIFAMGVIVGPAIGPVIGGVLTDSFSWRWAFFINIPVGTLAAFLAATYLRDPEKPRPMKLDAIGLALLTIALGSLQYVLDQGQEKDWFSDGSIVTLSCVSALGTCAFALWELYGTDHPIVNLRVLRYRPILVGTVLSIALGFTLFGGVVLIPQYAQAVLGFTATLSGQLFLVQAGTSGMLTFVTVALLQSGKIPARVLVMIGFCLLGAGNWLLFRAETTSSDFGSMIPALVVLGFGMSQLFVPLTVASVGAVPAPVVPDAAAFTSLARQLGGSASTAALGTIAQRTSISSYAHLAWGVTLANPVVAHYAAQNGGPDRVVADLFAQIVGQATVIGYAEAALITAVISVILAPLALLLGNAASTDATAAAA